MLREDEAAGGAAGGLRWRLQQLGHRGLDRLPRRQDLAHAIDQTPADPVQLALERRCRHRAPAVASLLAEKALQLRSVGLGRDLDPAAAAPPLTQLARLRLPGAACAGKDQA